jgi:hypothetical protein
MNRYVVRAGVHPHIYYAVLDAGRPVIADVVAETMEGIVTIESRPSPEGGELLQVVLRRPTHREAFEEIVRAVTQAGYSVLELEVSEIVDEAATGAMLGLLGGGAPGALADNPFVAFLGAAAGWWAGREVGASMRKVGAIHRYQFFSTGGWVHTQIAGEAEAQARVTGGKQPPPELGTTPELAY